MFKVYGVTQETAKKAAEREIEKLPIDKRPKTVEEHQALLAKLTEKHFNKMTPVVIGKSFDAPQFAQELINLTKQTTRARALGIRINAPALDNKGGIMINKKTKQPRMAWQPYDENTNYEEVFQRMEVIKEQATKEAA